VEEESRSIGILLMLVFHSQRGPLVFAFHYARLSAPLYNA
jgi:hypothetical protein